MTELQDMPGVQRTGAARMPAREKPALAGGTKARERRGPEWTL